MHTLCTFKKRGEFRYALCINPPNPSDMFITIQTVFAILLLMFIHTPICTMDVSILENKNQKRIAFGNKEHTKSRKSETRFDCLKLGGKSVEYFLSNSSQTTYLSK